MIKKELARSLAPLVNVKASNDALLEYANSRIDELKERLVSAHNWDEVKSLQGAIYEISRLKTLRDEVNNGNT